MRKCRGFYPFFAVVCRSFFSLPDNLHFLRSPRSAPPLRKCCLPARCVGFGWHNCRIAAIISARDRARESSIGRKKQKVERWSDWFKRQLKVKAGPDWLVGPIDPRPAVSEQHAQIPSGRILSSTTNANKDDQVVSVTFGCVISKECAT